MRMWQLVNSHRRSSGPIVAKVFTIDFVVSSEVVHVDEVDRHFDYIFELRAHGFQDVAHVFQDGLRLRSDIELRRSKFVDLRASNGVIGAARARPGNKQKITRALDVRIFAARLGLPLNNFAFHFPHALLQWQSSITTECKYCSAPNKNS